MSTPSVTLAQVLSTVAAVIGLGVAFGLNLTKDQQDGIVQVITVGYPVFLFADSVIRHGRSTKAAAEANHATEQLKSLPPDGDDALTNPTV